MVLSGQCGRLMWASTGCLGVIVCVTVTALCTDTRATHTHTHTHTVRELSRERRTRRRRTRWHYVETHTHSRTEWRLFRLQVKWCKFATFSMAVRVRATPNSRRNFVHGSYCVHSPLCVSGRAAPRARSKFTSRLSACLVLCAWVYSRRLRLLMRLQRVSTACCFM